MSKIENISVSKLDLMLSGFDQIDPWLNKGDKEPLWDGSIIYYRGKERSNEGIKKRIPVQVKGKKAGYRESVGYPIPVDNLNKYKDDGGVLYFVVYGIGEGEEEVITYNFLTPAKINSLLNGKKGNQVRVSVSMKKYTGEKKDFLRDLDKYIDDSDHQKGHVGKPFKKMKDLEQEYLTGVVFRTTLNKGDSFTKYNDFSTYYTVKGSSVLHPIAKEGYVETLTMSRDVKVNIKIGSKEYKKVRLYDTSNYGKGSNEVKDKIFKIVVVEGFCIIYKPISEEMEIEYELPDMLGSRYEWLKLMNELLTTNKIYINGFECHIELKKINIDEIKEEISNIKKFKQVMDFVGLDIDIDIKDNKNRDIIFELYEWLIENKNIHLEKNSMYAWLGVELGGRKLLFVAKFIHPTGTECKIYKMGEGDMPDLSIVNGKEQKDWLKGGMYNLLGVEDIVGCVNFNYKDYVEANIRDRTDKILANDALLKLIHVADGLHGEEREEVLRYCYTLATEKFDTNNFIHKVNMCQVIYRMGRLTTKQKIEIREMSDKSDIHNFIVEVLTGTPEMAECYFNKLGDEEKESLKKWPIYTLYEDSSKV